MVGLGKHTLFGLAVLGAAGVPYALTTVTQPASGTPAAELAAEVAASIPGPTGEDSWRPALGQLAERFTTTTEPPPIEGPQVANFAEVLRFDVGTSWVISRWPRVLNNRYGADLQAYRMPLVTGPKDADLAGSLTYFFNLQQKVQQIRFQGTTGDPRPLVEYLVLHYHFLQAPTSDPSESVYQVKRNGQAVSHLRVTAAPVLEAAAAHSRYRVDLVLERPSDHRWFSEAPRSIDHSRWP